MMRRWLLGRYCNIGAGRERAERGERKRRTESQEPRSQPRPELRQFAAMLLLVLLLLLPPPPLLLPPLILPLLPPLLLPILLPLLLPLLLRTAYKVQS